MQKHHMKRRRARRHQQLQQSLACQLMRHQVLHFHPLLAVSLHVIVHHHPCTAVKLTSGCAQWLLQVTCQTMLRCQAWRHPRQLRPGYLPWVSVIAIDHQVCILTMVAHVEASSCTFPALCAQLFPTGRVMHAHAGHNMCKARCRYSMLLGSVQSIL